MKTVCFQPWKLALGQHRNINYLVREFRSGFRHIRTNLAFRKRASAHPRIRNPLSARARRRLQLPGVTESMRYRFVQCRSVQESARDLKTNSHRLTVRECSADRVSHQTLVRRVTLLYALITYHNEKSGEKIARPMRAAKEEHRRCETN